MRGLSYQTTSGAAARPAGSPRRYTSGSAGLARLRPGSCEIRTHAPARHPPAGRRRLSHSQESLSGRCSRGASGSGSGQRPRLRPTPRLAGPSDPTSEPGPAAEERRRGRCVPGPGALDAGWEHRGGRSGGRGHRRARAAQAQRAASPPLQPRDPRPRPDAALTGQRLLLRRRQQQGPRPSAPSSAAASSSAAATNRPSAPPTDTTAGAAEAATSGRPLGSVSGAGEGRAAAGQSRGAGRRNPRQRRAGRAADTAATGLLLSTPAFLRGARREAGGRGGRAQRTLSAGPKS